MSSPAAFSHYRVVSKLGEGGMGEVWRATDTKLNRDVAIKVIPDSYAQDPDRMARFAREAQVLASLNHPNIAVIHGVEERAIVMELVDGSTLAGPLPLDEALPLIRQLIEALEYAHEKGVVHRDLKPANVLVTPEGRLKILDFGLAKALSNETHPSSPLSSPTLTMRASTTGTIMGTAAYMAPEQARGQSVDKRADIWAFGVVVYELLTGKLLFDAPTVSDTLAAVLTKELDLTPIPERIRPLLRRCLERDPRKRLRDIGDATLLIEETQAPQVPARKRQPAWAVIAIAATLAACVFAALWLRTPARPALSYRFALDTSGPIVFSPNGRWMINIANGLKVRSLDDVRWRLLPGTEAASDAFWSPDSSTVGFFANGHLQSISLDGTGLRTLAPARQPLGGSWRGGVADGVILFAAARQLQTLDIRTGKVTELPLRFSESAPALPVFCPQGDSFVYLLPSGGSGELFRSTLSSSKPAGERLLQTKYGVTFARHPHTGRWHIFFVRTDAGPGLANRSVLTAPVNPRTGELIGDPVRIIDAMSNWVGTNYASFDVGDGGIVYWRNTTPSLPIWRLHWFDRNGNVTGTIGDAAGYASLSLSPDESKVAVLQGYPEQHVWIYNFQNGTGTRVSSQSGTALNPVWSPDGRAIYYSSPSESGPRIFRHPIEQGSSPELMFEGAEGILSVQDITPDGRYLIVAQFGPKHPALLRLDVTASETARKLEPIFDTFPDLTGQLNSRVSPDGRSILVVIGTNAFSARYPPAGDSLHPIGAFNTVAWPFFSRDSRLLYFVSGQALYSHPVVPLPGGGFRLGDRSLLFKLNHPARADANLGAASRDGSRVLAIATDDTEEVRVQVLSDWTTLLPHAPQ